MKRLHEFIDAHHRNPPSPATSLAVCRNCTAPCRPSPFPRTRNPSHTGREEREDSDEASRTAVHRLSTGRAAPRTNSTLQCSKTAGQAPWATHARRVVDQRPTHCDASTPTVRIARIPRSPKRRNPRSRRVSPGVSRSRLRDSNPRPTHYETMSDHVAWCLAVLRGDVFPDQSMFNRLTHATP